MLSKDLVARLGLLIIEIDEDNTGNFVSTGDEFLIKAYDICSQEIGQDPDNLLKEYLADPNTQFLLKYRIKHLLDSYLELYFLFDYRDKKYLPHQPWASYLDQERVDTIVSWFKLILDNWLEGFLMDRMANYARMSHEVLLNIMPIIGIMIKKADDPSPTLTLANLVNYALEENWIEAEAEEIIRKSLASCENNLASIIEKRIANARSSLENRNKKTALSKSIN